MDIHPSRNQKRNSLLLVVEIFSVERILSEFLCQGAEFSDISEGKITIKNLGLML
jgi:hypothetical protein